MKILVSSHAFAPSIGGIETVTALLSGEFHARGHEIRVVTQTPGEAAAKFSFEVIRRPSFGQLRQLIKWCDLFWHNNLSLRMAWPEMFLRKPFVITHQGSYCMKPRGFDLALRLKRRVAERSKGIAISRFVAACFDNRPVVIPNPYDAGSLAPASSTAARTGLVFLGRLVSEKGLDVLLQALALLRAKRLEPALTVVGSGPEEMAMQKLAMQLGLQNQVRFVGSKRGPELGEILNRHQVMVVPSRYDEPFGIAALEGIACGCAVIGSSGGGLPEAIGPCGITFPNGKAEALAQSIEKLSLQPEAVQRLIAGAPEHLRQFQPAVIADSYLEFFEAELL